MGLSYVYTSEEGYLLVTASGSPDSRDEMVGYVAGTPLQARQRGYARLLFDETRVVVNMEYHEAALSFVKEMEKGLIRPYRAAVLCAPHSRELYDFFEGLLLNKGITDTRMFSDREEAVVWLLEEDVAKQES